MSRRRGLRRIVKLVTVGGILLGITLSLSRIATPQSGTLASEDFLEVAPQGFGDRQNSGTWSMAWWNGKLYVGTVRAFYCWVQAWIHMQDPVVFPYPPHDPDKQCARIPLNLPLQAEIWRYTPETAAWTRVYQSPKDVPIPGHPGAFTARDIGYRTMAVFTEPDGTEALYVGGATANLLWPPLPPPRILRSTDGNIFRPVPQAPGTLLGDPPNVGSFRSMAVHNGRLYVVDGTIQGAGPLLEAANPAGGNNNFRVVTPAGMTVFQVASFNGFLYVGVGDLRRGYAVLKTDATGTPPYRFVPVVTHGAFLSRLQRASVVSMHVFNGRLYVGTDGPALLHTTGNEEATDGPAELIRINPDDSWDLLLGKPRVTPTGTKEPLSGLGAGFDWILNTHIWQMQAHEGALYIGTLDSSTNWKDTPLINRLIEHQFGFDLYHTSDGFYFVPISTNGLGDKFQLGLRALASSPQGLFAGSVSYWFGLRLWQGIPTPRALEPAMRLEVEKLHGKGAVLLSWDPPAGATRFHVFRAGVAGNVVKEVGTPDASEVPGPPREIATTGATVFVDGTGEPTKHYHYFVVAENAAGAMSDPSNLVRAPSLASPVTFQGLENNVLDWGGRNGVSLVAQLQKAADDLTQGGDYDAALHDLAQVGQAAQDDPTLLPSWRVDDLQILLAKLMRRVVLAQAGFIAISNLL